MELLYLTFTLFLLGIFTTFNKRTSYSFATLASVSTFALSVFGIIGNTFSKDYFSLLGINMGFSMDHTTAIFLFIASLSWFSISLYSVDYGRWYSKRMSAFLNIAMLGMLLALVAKDGLTFLIGWELATVFSYLLIVEHRNSFKEAFDFLAFGEISTISLIIAFAYLYFTDHTLSLTTHAGNFFLLMTTLAFITKMGIFPLHTWLIGAHSKSPSNVSAYLSAPLTLMGIYGLVRVLSMCGHPSWWGISAMVVGGVTAFWGALQAVAAKKLKILPAYSTVENNGIILTLLGFSVTAYFMGIGVLGEFSMLAALIFTFAHVVAKTLLFLSVGHAKVALNEDDIDDVRGVWRTVGKVPALSILFATLSFSVFPPLIGYVSEWMMLETLFQSYKFSTMSARLVAAFSGIFIALAMGMVAFSMVKLAGYTALGGNPNKRAVKIPHWSMNASEIFLSFVILISGLFSPLLVEFLGYKDFLFGLLGVPKPFLIVSSHPIFGVVSPTFLAVVVGVLGIFPLIFYLLNAKKVKRVEAWNGGITLKDGEYFTVPAYSFTLEYILGKVYARKEYKSENERYVTVRDVVYSLYDGLKKATDAVSRALSKFLMNGHVYSYVAYIAVVFVLIFFVVR